MVAGWPPEDPAMTFAAFHGHESHVDPDHERTENAKALAWLDQPHRIDARTEEHLREQIASWPEPPATVVPTHGDWRPGNWLVDEGVVSVIDFGRAALRPALTDFTRLAARTSEGTRRWSAPSSRATAVTRATRRRGRASGSAR